jgi:predicted Fe-Mo cluster-binding NifX family protein
MRNLPNKLQIVEQMLQNGAEVNIVRGAGNTALLNAVNYEGSDALKIVDLLLRNGAIFNYFGQGPAVLDALAHNKGAEGLEIAQLLLKNGVSLLSTNSEGKIALEFICRGYCTFFVRVQEHFKTFAYLIERTLHCFYCNSKNLTDEEKVIFQRVLTKLSSIEESPFNAGQTVEEAYLTSLNFFKSFFREKIKRRHSEILPAIRRNRFGSREV